MINPRLVYQVSKQVCKHPTETLCVAQEILVATAPVVLPVALIAGIGYGIYRLCQEPQET